MDEIGNLCLSPFSSFFASSVLVSQFARQSQSNYNAAHDARGPMTNISGPPDFAADSVTQILHSIRSHLEMDVAFVSEFVGDRMIFRHVDAANRAPMNVGDSRPLEESYCQRVMDGRLPKLIPDTVALPTAMALPATTALPIGSFLGVPIRLSEGRIYGAFCCFSFAPDPSLNPRDLSMMQAFSENVAQEIERDFEKARVHDEKLARVKTLFKYQQLSIAYQPIIRLADNRIVGLESLLRISASPSRAPDIWFFEAAEVGLGAELEIAAIRLALSSLAALPADVYLTVNLSPAMISSGEILRLMEGVPAERIVLEISEHAIVSDYSDLVHALQPLRNAGLRLAVDDVGAGYASLRHILNLRPDMIKLDICLVRDIAEDATKRALTLALIGFARETGSEIVADGVGAAADLGTIKTLGVEKAQGHFLGRPLPLAKITRLLTRKSA